MGSINDRQLESTSGSGIFGLFDAVRTHPDYAFGTIFVPDDFPDNEVPENFPYDHAEDRLGEDGNEYINLLWDPSEEDE